MTSSRLFPSRFVGRERADKRLTSRSFVSPSRSCKPSATPAWGLAANVTRLKEELRCSIKMGGKGNLWHGYWV